MHLTVRFIGEVEAARSDSVLAALQPPLPMAPFDAALGPCGVFPRAGAPRVIWLGLSEGVAALQAMHDEFNRRLLPLGLQPEDRPFSGHLTLARLKDAPRSSAAIVRAAIDGTQPARVRWRIDDAVVFQSQLSARGATYKPLLHVPCTA